MSQQQMSSSDYQNNFNIGSYSSQGKLDISEQSIVYPGSSFYVSPMTNTQPSPSASYYYDNQHHYSQQSHFIQGSPESTFMSSSPPTQHGKLSTCSPSSIMIQDPPMLVASSSSTTTASTMSSSSVEFLNEAFAKASSLPESFYPEFLQYSKETYEQSTGGGPNRKKQKKASDGKEDNNSNFQQNQKDDSDNDDDTTNSNSNLSSTELRRQIHIQSEQKRRAQIKDGFEELRNELPACLNKKMSKVALLHRTVQHIQHLKETQMSILSELERLVHENEQLRKFQEGVLQKQALENMYTMTNM
ncbi:MLX-interacting protein [Choanephora cucurbitarum]|uniref:MLX-interacting protein n=1 Tax=Choanephora cucurbitarum TaxID=101091 RepID=A0A1C7NQD7_9FUNG|nr:MLX-interacting protein [Choanephora cucurbitarum]